VPWRFFGLLGFDTERVVGREVVDSFFLFCLDTCLVAVRRALCCWRRRWPALRVKAWYVSVGDSGNASTAGAGGAGSC